MADRNAPVGANLSRLWQQLLQTNPVPEEAPPSVAIPGQRRTEDRAAMAAEAAARFDEEERRLEARRAFVEAQAQMRAQREEANRAARQAWREGQSAITNRPVGAATAAAPPAPAPAPAPATRGPRQMSTAEREADLAAMREANEPVGRGRASAAASRSRSRTRAPGMSEADRLNEISLAFARGERPRGGAADNIGRAMGIEGYKKGGLVGAKKPVKRAMGGSIPKPPAPPKPKVPGRKAGRPSTAVKVPPRKAPTAPKMPAFKKGGKVTMKGKRK